MIGIFAVSSSRFGVVIIQVSFLTWMTDLNSENELGMSDAELSALWQKQVLLT
jgi:hypothetical protein